MRFRVVTAIIIGGISVVAASFWITLLVLDYWEPRRDVRTGAPSQPPRPQASRSKIVFVLNPADRAGWAEVDARKTKASISSKGISLESIAAIYESQWTTDLIAAQTNTDYTVLYEIEVTRGKLAVGVMDATNDKWITVKEIDKRSDTIAFKAPSARMRLVLFAASPPPTVAMLSSLKITEP